MMLMGNFIAQLIIFLIIAGLITILIKNKRASRKRLFRGKRGYQLLGVYSACLVIVTIIYFSTVKEVPANFNKIEIPDLTLMAYEGRAKDIPDVYIKEQGTYQIDADELNIKVNGNNGNDITVIVEQNETADGEIEVVRYQTPTLINNMDLTEDIDFAEINIKGHTIFVEFLPELELNFYSFRKELVMMQFSETGWRYDSYLTEVDIEIGDQLLYLKVPKNLKIKADEDVDINYEK